MAKAKAKRKTKKCAAVKDLKPKDIAAVKGGDLPLYRDAVAGQSTAKTKVTY